MSVDERTARLVDQLNRPFPGAWRPAEGDPDQIVGVVTRIERGTTSYGPCVVAVLQRTPSAGPTSGGSEDGEIAVWLLHTVLKNQWNKHRPVVGELVAIKWLGKRTPAGGGSSYDDYRVAVDRDTTNTGTVDRMYDEMLGRPEHDETHDATAAMEDTQPVTASGETCDKCGGPEPYHSSTCPMVIPF